jgi:hypothetical protein
MPERSAMFETSQLGIETTPGTSVAADKKLLATSFVISPNAEVSTFRPMGYKYNTIASLDRESVEVDIEGQMSYTDLAYLFASLCHDDAPATVGTTGKEYVFTSDSDGPDTPLTFTVEQGSSVRAHKFANGQVIGLTLTINNDGCEVSGTMIGEALQDGITLTATPTEIALQPVMRTEVGVKLADAAASLAAASFLTRALSVEWSLTDRYAPLWTLNQSTTYDVTVESEPSGEVTLMLAADATGMGLLTTMRAGATKFIRIQATGPVIGAGPATYSLIIDTAIKITEVSEIRDEENIIAVEWTGTFTHDATWTKAFNVAIINALADL